MSSGMCKTMCSWLKLHNFLHDTLLTIFQDLADKWHYYVQQTKACSSDASSNDNWLNCSFLGEARDVSQSCLCSGEIHLSVPDILVQCKAFKSRALYAKRNLSGLDKNDHRQICEICVHLHFCEIHGIGMYISSSLVLMSWLHKGRCIS